MSKFKWFLVILAALPFLGIAIVYRDSEVLFAIGTFELLCIAIVVNTFVIVYWRRNWKANPYGRALMYSKISLALLADLSFVTGFLGPDWEYRYVIRVILFTGILIAQTRLLQLLFSLRHKNARDLYYNSQETEVK